ncbi:YbaB/EbfC family nucleoid-associated protein [Micromonospora sp. STR1_7]|uniref:YbaB/EbfC family nucleoid-associated protein n=1 Tax=Micromonospora parastrephiae TaxID=2806101 RepID=A0ABS1XZC6_9ACTN|nr:YbaB/EbfC family nucleoid-associated protein [Micromonospora parastrephiae]MBM0234583.1 YbaB/EbfC family nucleoid-associated protein [Micromonospora parastrephiae]
MTEFDRLFQQTRQALASMRSTGQAPDDGTGVQPARGTGSAAGGQVEVVAVGQRVESVTVDPRALRMGAEMLGEQITLAVNAALDDLRLQAGDAVDAPAVDPVALGQQLDELQNESVRSMAAMTDALTDAVRRIQQAAR